MELQSNITRENLRHLMTLFYMKAMNDDVLGPFFINELGDDITSEEWVEHIDLLADFWLAKLLGENTYIGNFIGAHIKLPLISRESFVRWIKLFSQSADEVYNSDVSSQFKEKGILFSEQFMSEWKL